MKGSRGRYGVKMGEITMCPSFQPEELMASLPKSEQVNLIMEALGKYWEEGDRFWLLEALKRILKDDQIELRKQLMIFYANQECMSFVETQEKPVSDAFKRALLKEILQGWDWQGMKKNDDAEKCFLFFCQNLHHDTLRDEMIQTLREHISSRNPGHKFYEESKPRDKWHFSDLDEWILHAHVPDDILEVLLHARVRLGGGVNLRAEMEFFESLGPNLQHYLGPAGPMSLVQETIARIRETFELLSHIGDPIAPEELTGKPNSEAFLTPEDKVCWRWDAPGLVEVRIEFGGMANLEAVAKLQELSAEVVRKSGLPIQVMVEARKSIKSS